MSQDILKYESKVWATADLLIASSIKQSDFPKFMMPFFALIMVESRLIKMARELRKELSEEGVTLSKEEFIEELEEKGQGFNKYIFNDSKTLKDICNNDKTFGVDFDAYLKGFDGQTQDLLGVDKSNDEEKFLDISGVCGLLRKKGILFSYVKAWSEINLIDLDNNEIIMLNKQIKKKFIDFTLEMDSEYYTPDDIISLISEIVTSKIKESDTFLTIYDPACGSGNMLFGVEDRVNEKFKRPTATYGQELNYTIYVLAKIESRFRNNAYIEHDNTLTSSKFYDKEFDVIVSNPPYGLSWNNYKQDIKNDKTKRFIDLPRVSDGQFLFMQHSISKMRRDSIGVIVHNGSTLFSGDAGSGESNIRKWIFDKDIVEAIIQLPTDIFFNTSISTYLWILNREKKKPNKIIIINASEKYKLLKKNRGKKQKEIDEKSILDIVKTLNEFKDNEYAKVFDKEYFYYNKQLIEITNVDYKNQTIESILNNKKSLKLNPTKIVQNDIFIDEFVIVDFDRDKYATLKEYNERVIKEKIKNFDYKKENLKVYTKEAIYFYDSEKETIIKEREKIKKELGCGKIVIKSSYKKATKTKDEYILITVELTPDYQKDYKTISYTNDRVQNQKNIEEFIKREINKPFKYLDNTIGVKIMSYYMTNIKINHLRHLKNIDISIGKIKKHLILTGKNGSGKTSILKELDKFIISLLNGEISIKRFFLYQNNLNILENKDIEKFQNCYPIFNNNLFYQQTKNKNFDFIYSFFEAKRINQTNKPNGINKIDLPENKTVKLNNHFLQYIVNLKAEKSFARDDEDFETVKKINKWFNDFENMLKKIFNDNTLELIFDRKNYNFTIQRNNREPFDFNTLSDGYSAIIDIVTEIILKIENTTSKSFDCEGVVLIDEIETHLHLELQKNILLFLTTFFPNIQFIVTTHSPFVLQSIKNCVIYDLETHIRAEDLSEASYSGLVRKYFGLDSEYSTLLNTKFKEFEKLATKENLTEMEEDKLIELDIEFKNLSPIFSPELYDNYLKLRKEFLK